MTRHYLKVGPWGADSGTIERPTSGIERTFMRRGEHLPVSIEGSVRGATLVVCSPH